MKFVLLGALSGDIIGSVHEYRDSKPDYDFPLFTPESAVTDDSILTLAVAEAVLDRGSYLDRIRTYARRYPQAGYGSLFQNWMYSDPPKPYNSFGNGSAMRVSPIAWGFNTIEEVLHEAERTAVVTHNHPEGVKGAQAVSLAIFLARTGRTKDQIRAEIISRFGYDLSRTLAKIRPTYSFDETCQGTVPQAITAFLESNDFEDAVRKAVWLGGDADTLAAITGSIAEACYGGVPEAIAREVRARVPDRLWEVVERFAATFS